MLSYIKGHNIRSRFEGLCSHSDAIVRSVAESMTPLLQALQGSDILFTVDQVVRENKIESIRDLYIVIEFSLKNSAQRTVSLGVVHPNVYKLAEVVDSPPGWSNARLLHEVEGVDGVLELLLREQIVLPDWSGSP